MLTLAPWLRSRRSRFVFFLLCSPLLLPLLCASFPLLCAAEIFSRLRLLRRRIKKSASSVTAIVAAEDDDARLRLCEEGCGCGGGVVAEEEEGREACLLQRYLEDQLLLARSVYDCGEYDGGDDDDDDGDGDRLDRDPDRTTVPLLA